MVTGVPWGLKCLGYTHELSDTEWETFGDYHQIPFCWMNWLVQPLGGEQMCLPCAWIRYSWKLDSHSHKEETSPRCWMKTGTCLLRSQLLWSTLALYNGWVKILGIRDNSWSNELNSENAGKVDAILHEDISYLTLPGSKGWDNTLGLIYVPP